MVCVPMRISHLVPVVIVAVLVSACSGDNDGTPNSAPQLTTGTVADVDENSKGVFMRLRATDVDGDKLAFSLGGDDAHLFALDSHSGGLQFIQPPDYESPEDLDRDNQYQLTTMVRDGRGGQTAQPLTIHVRDVTFAYEILSPLPNTILELHRYTRLPVALRVAYDYPEKLQVIVDGEIMNPASDSGMTLAGSINLESHGSDANVEMVFMRGEEVLERKIIPVRHQHVISDHQHLIYDSINDQVVIPHPQRLETLLIDLRGNSTKQYPWAGQVPQARDFIFDAVSGSALYTSSDTVSQLHPAGTAAPLLDHLQSDILSAPRSSLAFNEAARDLYVLDRPGRFARINLSTGALTNLTYTSQFGADLRVQGAYDPIQGRLFISAENGAGTESINPATPGPASSAPFAPAIRFGQVAYAATENALYLAGLSGDLLAKLDLATAEYEVVSGPNRLADDVAINLPVNGNSPVIGEGPPLYAPYTLELDSAGRLLTTSGGRLLAVDTTTGERTTVFDSSAGAGALTSGFAAVRVVPDGSTAVAIGRRAGVFYDINLRTGQKLSHSYAWPQGRGAAIHYEVQRAKISLSREFAVVQSIHRDTGENFVDLVRLSAGTTENLLALSESNLLIADVNFSQPEDQLILLVKEGDQYGVWTYSPPYKAVHKSALNLDATTAALAAQRVQGKLYVLERQMNPAQFVLSRLGDGAERVPLLTVAETATEGNGAAGIDALFQDSVLAISLPGQNPRFWDVRGGTEQDLSFAEFHGSDQPADFQSIEDFNENYYMRTNAGLHICWRFYCAILAN